MKVEIGKQYRTQSGLPVRILCTDRKDYNPVIGLIFDGRCEIIGSWTCDGKSSCLEQQLVEIGPYDDFKIDDLVMVRDNNSMSWKKRHFAGVGEKGLPQSWGDGRTSWTTGIKTEWYQCRRPTEEELEKI